MGSRLALAFIKLIARLPYSTLYALSNFVFVVVYRILKYRKKVVIQNLKNSFPEKSDKEIEKISKEFYEFLSDLFLESLKATTVSAEVIKDRMRIKLHPDYLKAIEEKRNIILVIGHYGNWEYAQLRYSLLEERHRFVGIYKKIGNDLIEEYMYKARERFGTDLVEVKGTSKHINMVYESGEPFILALVGDQSPSKERGYWMDFLNQDTPVFFGAEHYAKKFNAQVFFCDIDRVKRGFYTYSVTPLIKEPLETENGEITEVYTKHLESIIKNKPELWIWSHKRWKHKRPAELPENQISTKYPGQ